MSHNDLHIKKEKCENTTGQKVNNVIDVLPNNVPHLSSKSEILEDSVTIPSNSNIQEFSESNEPVIEKALQVPLQNLPSKSCSNDKEDKDEQLILRSPSSLPSIPLKSVPAQGAIPKILQNLPSTSKSSPRKLKHESSSIIGSYSYLYYEPNKKTKLKSSSQDSSFKSIPVHNSSSSSSSIDSSSMLPKTPEPFLISSELTEDTKNSLLQLNNFLTQLKGGRDYSVPEINTNIEIAAIDENVKLNKLASRKFFSLNPRNVSIKDESPLKNISKESLIAFYDLDTFDSEDDENNN